MGHLMDTPMDERKPLWYNRRPLEPQKLGFVWLGRGVIENRKNGKIGCMDFYDNATKETFHKCSN
jgi:hypothetical protein